MHQTFPSILLLLTHTISYLLQPPIHFLSQKPSDFHSTEKQEFWIKTMRYQSGLITDHAEYAKWRQRSTRKEKVEKKYISARFLKKEKKKKRIGKEKKDLHSFVSLVIK